MIRQTLSTSALTFFVLAIGSMTNAEAANVATFTRDEVAKALMTGGCEGLGLDATCPVELAECDRIIAQFRGLEASEVANSAPVTPVKSTNERPQQNEPFALAKAQNQPFAAPSNESTPSDGGLPWRFIVALTAVLIVGSFALNDAANGVKTQLQKLLP